MTLILTNDVISNTGLEAKFTSGAAYPGGALAIQSSKPGAVLMVGILMNRLVDRCSNIGEKDREAAVRLVIAEYGELLKTAAVRKTVLVFFPFPRSGVEWTLDMLDMIHDTL